MQFRVRKFRSQKGFTLIELIIVTTISAIMFSLITFNLLRVSDNTSSKSNMDTLVSDIKSQQIKAMIGATEGRSTNDNYGIYFLADKYVLFHGISYDVNEPTNFVIDLPTDIEISATTFPNNTLLFTKISGEVSGFSQGSNTVTLRAKNINTQTVVTVNRYGVIESIN